MLDIVVVVVADGETSVRCYVIAVEAKLRVYIFAFRRRKGGECHIPCSDVLRRASLACGCTGDKHLINLRPLVSEIEEGVPCRVSSQCPIPGGSR